MKIARLIIVLATTLFLTACSKTTELGNRAIIQEMAIDHDNEIYRVSALLFSSGSKGGEVLDASQENVIKVSGEGATLSEALDNISLIDGKSIYMSETKLIVMGEGFSKTSCIESLMLLYSDMKCSLDTPVCYAKKAEMLTDMHFTEGATSAEKPLDMIENAHNTGVSPKPLLLDILADSYAGKATLIPMFSEFENGFGMTTDEKGKTAVISGSCQLKNGLIVSEYGIPETYGLMLITGESDSMPLNYFHDGVQQTCHAYSIKVKASTEKEGALSITARFRKRNGGKLSESEEQSAMERLKNIIRSAM